MATKKKAKSRREPHTEKEIIEKAAKRYARDHDGAAQHSAAASTATRGRVTLRNSYRILARYRYRHDSAGRLQFEAE